jgi:hypothetical protein
MVQKIIISAVLLAIGFVSCGKSGNPSSAGSPDNTGAPVLWESFACSGFNWDPKDVTYIYLTADSVWYYGYENNYEFCFTGVNGMALAEGDTVDVGGGSSHCYHINGDTLIYYFFEDGDTANPEIAWHKKSSFANPEELMDYYGPCYTQFNCDSGTIGYEFDYSAGKSSFIRDYIDADEASRADSNDVITGSMYTWGGLNCDTIYIYSEICLNYTDTSSAVYGCTYLDPQKDSILVIKYDHYVELMRDTILTY